MRPTTPRCAGPTRLASSEWQPVHEASYTSAPWTASPMTGAGAGSGEGVSTNLRSWEDETPPQTPKASSIADIMIEIRMLVSWFEAMRGGQRRLCRPSPASGAETQRPWGEGLSERLRERGPVHRLVGGKPRRDLRQAGVLEGG